MSAQLCRLVFVRPGSDKFLYGKWREDSADLQRRVGEFNAKPGRRYDVYIQDPPPAQLPPPTHTPLRGALPGQKVWRYYFKDGSTADAEWTSVHVDLSLHADQLRYGREIERVTLAQVAYAQKEQGRKAGEKGGRKSDKPFNVELQRRYQKLIGDTGSAREARATLVKELSAEYGCDPRTARNWLIAAKL